MARRAKLRLLGAGWFGYGGNTVPDDGVIEVSEEDAASFLRHRGSARKVEFLGWVEEQPDPEEQTRT